MEQQERKPLFRLCSVRSYLTSMFALYFWAKFISTYQKAKFGRNLLRTLLAKHHRHLPFNPLALIGYLLPTTGGNRLKSSVVVRCILSLTYQSTITTRTGTFPVQLPFHQPHLLLGSEASWSSGYSCGGYWYSLRRSMSFLSFILEGRLVAVNLVYLTAYFYFCMFRAGAPTAGTVK